MRKGEGGRWYSVGCRIRKQERARMSVEEEVFYCNIHFKVCVIHRSDSGGRSCLLHYRTPTQQICRRAGK